MAVELIDELAQDTRIEIHVVGHSAGSIFHAPLVRLLTAKKAPIASGFLNGHTGYGMKVESCSLWAPACTIRLFKEAYLPALKDGAIKRFTLFTLTDEAEQEDHCANIYHKSLLYLVSNAFEGEPRIPLFREGEAILGMEKFVAEDKDLRNLFKKENCEWILAPNTEPPDSEDASTARHHGDFDDDKPTVKATLARIIGRTKMPAKLVMNRSASSLRDRRQQLAAAR